MYFRFLFLAFLKYNICPTLASTGWEHTSALLQKFQCCSKSQHHGQESQDCGSEEKQPPPAWQELPYFKTSLGSVQDVIPAAEEVTVTS